MQSEDLSDEGSKQKSGVEDESDSEEGSETSEIKSSLTVSTQKKEFEEDTKLKREKRPENPLFAKYGKEPARSANSKKWLLKRDKIHTIILDEEVKERMSEPHAGL